MPLELRLRTKECPNPYQSQQDTAGVDHHRHGSMLQLGLTWDQDCGEEVSIPHEGFPPQQLLAHWIGFIIISIEAMNFKGTDSRFKQ